MNVRWARLWIVLLIIDAIILLGLQVATLPEQMAPPGHRAGGRIIAKGCTQPMPLECWVTVSHWQPTPEWVIQCCSPALWGAWEVTLGATLGDYRRHEVGDWYDRPSTGGRERPRLEAMR